MTRFFAIASLLIYFFWGQGFAFGWAVCIPFYILIALVIWGKVDFLQWLIGIYLLVVTFFLPPTFGYSDMEESKYEAGYTDGKYAHDYYGGINDTPDDWWEGHKEKASVDISKYKKYYIYGFKRGLKGSKK
ncbi:MAG: hypothetical protein HDS48_05605 [Bacteroides sp.]|nr:hypothetical protein [Bacteroides sp.]